MISMFICIEAKQAQSQNATNKFEIGAGAGVFIYQGDLTPSRFGSFKTPGYVFTLFGAKILDEFLSLRTNLSFGKLRGDDAKYSSPAWRQQRNFNFSSTVLEISELAVWNISGANKFIKPKTFSPYLFAGIGFSFLNTKRDWSRFNSEYFAGEPATLSGLTADAKHSLPKIIPVLPVGAGVRYSLSQQLSAFAESSYRFTATDYLDGFSKAANPAKNDHYTNYSVGLIYRLGINNPLDCPAMKN